MATQEDAEKLKAAWQDFRDACDEASYSLPAAEALTFNRMVEHFRGVIDKFERDHWKLNSDLSELTDCMTKLASHTRKIIELKDPSNGPDASGS